MDGTDEESQEHREKRIAQLWKTLDVAGRGELDFNGLRKGLKKIDHPLKNADSLLHDVLKAADTSGDGQIQYNEFRVFVEHAERELWQLFESIDRDHDGELDKDELRAAFSRAGLAISNAKLDQFFDEVDVNHDGVISFDEWRSFLLFIPAPKANLRAVLSYYSATATVNQEGDVHINDAMQGLGTAPVPIHTLISIMASRPCPEIFHASLATAMLSRLFSQTPLSRDWNLLLQIPDTKVSLPTDVDPKLPPANPDTNMSKRNHLLTRSSKALGYFLAGACAGIASRTATAPLDRLKVYLIAQTSSTKAAVEAVKGGSPVKAARQFGRPLVDAMKDLWAAGGIRSLFAGNGLNVLKVAPESAIKFGAYEASKRAFARFEGHDNPKHLHPWTQFMAGGIGGVVSQLAVYPLDTLKFRMQCETVSGGLHGNALIKQTTQKLWHNNGFLAYYRGLGLGLLGMFPYSAIDLFIFETGKHLVLQRKARLQRCHEEDVEMGNVITGVIGATSGAVSATIVYPLNLLRTRLQAQGTILHKPTYTGIVDVTRRTIQNEGFRGLFKGVTPNLLKVAPAISISYIVYENSKKVLGLQ